MFPLIGSVTRHLASLRRIPRGSVLRLHRYYQGAPTPAARPAPLPFVRQAVPRTTARREAAGSCCFRLLVGAAAGASIRRLRLALVETCGFSQVPRQPLCEHALLFDPGGPDASGHCDTPDVAFRSVDDVGSAIGHISRLNHTACSLAVYASRLGLLRSHHARLASRWRPTLAGQDLNLLGCFRRFLSVMSLHITSIPLRQALPGAPTAVTPSRWRRSSRLGRRAEAGPCQLHTRVRPPLL